ncbi:MAG TPA: DegT/DnrJ/EryC1/StrS family aminotransferase [Verrucomicrobiae bacterium]|nr:DegT/DnrJ/EryC1/StrS family aminotransferase [Verrucomicrobiae bacterium]
MPSAKRKRIFLSPPHMSGTELDLIVEVFASNYIAPLGPMVEAFEQDFAEYTGVRHCLALASGTAAMHLALRGVGIGPGDEVLASTLTFIASVSPARFQGASLTFIDSGWDSWCMDPELLAEELEAAARRGKLPKAVIPTDIYGQCADLARIRRLCSPLGIAVIADSAEAMGACYRDPFDTSAPQGGANSVAQRRPWRHAGAGATAAVFSFNGNKIITTSGGGMLASENQELIEHARKLSQQAREPAPHYEHSEIGYNYRMSNVLAAIGRAQLGVLDSRVAARRRIFSSYQRLLSDLPGLTFMPEPVRCRSNRWLTVILIEPREFGATREEVRLALEAANIEARPVWKPMHLQPVFRGCRIRGGSVSEELFETGLCLPSGSAMTESDLERVSQAIRRCHYTTGRYESSVQEAASRFQH